MARASHQTPLSRRAVDLLRSYLEHRKRDGEQPRHHRARIAAGFALVFLLAAGVRMLHLRDSFVEIQSGEGLSTTLIRPYLSEAGRMRDAGLLFPSKPPIDQDARMILHPPGYSMILYLLGEDGSSNNEHRRLRIIQLLCDSAAAVLVALIGTRLFRLAIGVVAGVLAALSPHLAYYSLWLTPETLAVPPLLLAIFIVANRRERICTWQAAMAG